MSAVDLGGSALWPLAFSAVLFGCAALLFFRRFADHALLRRSTKRLLARFLELRLFMDDPVLLLRSQRDLMVENLYILRAIARPLLLFLLPAVPAMLLLDGCFARAPLPLHTPAILTVQFNAPPRRLETVRLAAPNEIKIETAPLRVPSDEQVSWRISPVSVMHSYLTIEDGARCVRKSIAAGPCVQFLSARRRQSIAGSLFAPTELPFRDRGLAWIQIDYPPAVILGHNWLVWFCAFCLAGTLLTLVAIHFYW